MSSFLYATKMPRKRRAKPAIAAENHSIHTQYFVRIRWLRRLQGRNLVHSLAKPAPGRICLENSIAIDAHHFCTLITGFPCFQDARGKMPDEQLMGVVFDAYNDFTLREVTVYSDRDTVTTLQLRDA